MTETYATTPKITARSRWWCRIVGHIYSMTEFVEDRRYKVCLCGKRKRA